VQCDTVQYAVQRSRCSTVHTTVQLTYSTIQYGTVHALIIPECLVALPVVGTESPIKRFKREVFPHPFLPSKANRALEETLNSTSLKRDASPGHAKEAFVMLTSFSLLQRKRERVGARVRGCLEEDEEGGEERVWCCV
jgi:hypothetical protein